MDTTFARVIEDHLELKRRNSSLDMDMPLSRYQIDDPFKNHPLFKTEEQARIEDTLDGSEPDLNAETVLAWPAADTGEEQVPDPEDSFWGRSRDFDWGD
ncbi:MAG TPA: hypothetical protein VK896_08720 [Gaiellaceae bacterium]|nr:hypothetical protein [Gaiellaceae bacterium]